MNVSSLTATSFKTNTVAKIRIPTMSDLMLDVDQAGELKAAFRRGNWTNAEIKKACEGDFLARARQALLGYSEIKHVSHVIDCDADPFVPDGWKVEEHKKGGQFLWDAAKVELYLSKNQQKGRVIEGNKLRKELENDPMFNANLLDYLLKNPHLIPEEWKKDEKGNTRYIFFWGTVYRDSGGYLDVRALYWDGGAWRWSYGWLDHGWDGRIPAARRAS
jgi:hypothetical protein